jgi:hypothetical protein
MHSSQLVIELCPSIVPAKKVDLHRDDDVSDDVRQIINFQTRAITKPCS